MVSYPPSAPESALPFVKTLFADIRDEQDISQNLSAFSSHMARVSSAVREAKEGALVLLDELGSSTDPARGLRHRCLRAGASGFPWRALCGDHAL